MNYDNSIFLLYAVTTRSHTGGKSLLTQTEEALASGVTLLQLREKGLEHDEFLKEALQMRELTRRYHVPLIINDRVDIALECDADGVHIGQKDLHPAAARSLIGPNRILGVTAATIAQAKQAQLSGADYLGCGAVFPSPTKLDAALMHHETLRAICSSVKIPVVAIGGITAQNVKELAGTGISGASVISAIFAQPDIPSSVSSLKKQIKKVVV